MDPGSKSGGIERRDSAQRRARSGGGRVDPASYLRAAATSGPRPAPTTHTTTGWKGDPEEEDEEEKEEEDEEEEEEGAVPTMSLEYMLFAENTWR